VTSSTVINVKCGLAVNCSPEILSVWL